MQTLSWNQSHLTYEFHCVKGSGELQLGLHRLYRHSGSREKTESRQSVSGTPVLMLADFTEDTRSFFPNLEQSNSDTRLGLAPMLAAEGYDVFMLDLRGKGRSWPSHNREQAWGLHQAIMEDISLHLSAVARLRPACPQVWLGKGMGSVLLTCAYARLDVLPTTVLGMVHLAPGRRSMLNSLRKTLRDMTWRGLQLGASAFGGRIDNAALGPAPEGAQLAREWRNWRMSTDWRDPADGFNFGLALANKTLPPSLYLCPRKNHAPGDLADCRHWLEELGAHDAIVLSIDKHSGNQHNYSARELLTHKDAINDHLQNLHHWLAHITRDSSTPEKKLA